MNGLREVGSNYNKKTVAAGQLLFHIELKIIKTIFVHFVCWICCLSY